MAMVEIVKPLDLTGVLGKPKNRIARASVELEGGWLKLPPGVQLERDGSVFHDEIPAGYTRQGVGELPVGPIQPAGMPKFMKKYYPTLVDSSCGMHVHMSFESLRHYAWLMVPEFQETMIHYLTEWAKDEGFGPKHHIWGRLEGKSEFCQKKFWPDKQAAMKRKDHDRRRDGHRYTQVHYCGRYNTIEIRVLPMMVEAEQAIRAVQRVFDVTNAALFLLRDKQDKVKGKIILPVGEVYEEEIHEEIPLTAGERRRLR